MTKMRRSDHLMAQRVDVAIVFRDMLGADDATRYLREHAIPQHIVDRVLTGLAVMRIDGGEMVEYRAVDKLVNS
jgi:DNA-binding LacI/PurR family transcriptional regulator